MARRPGGSAEDPKDKAIDAALQLAAEKPWRTLSLADIAAEAGISLLELYLVLPGKPAILAGFFRRVDEAALAGPIDRDDPPRDRLFEVLMRRFEALKPHRAALKGLMRPDPELACVARRLPRSMALMLEAAGLSASGPIGHVRARVLGAAYLSVARTFLRDEGEDLAKTMAALDRALRRASPILGFGRPAEEPGAAA